MQSRRVTRRTALANDENSVAALAAVKGVDNGLSKAAKTRKADSNATEPAMRKRAALGDVSNVHKIVEAAKDEKTLAVKKTTRSALSTKASAVNGVSKTRASATKAPLKASSTNSSAETKRSNSGSGVMGARKRVRAGSAVPTAAPKAEARKAEEEVENDENSAPAEVKAVQKIAKVEVTETKVSAKVSKPAAVKVEAPKTARPEPEHLMRKPEIDDEPRPVRGVPLPVDDDIDDPCMVPEYITEIFDYLRKLEPTTQPNPDYMDHQRDLEWDTREILIDWLIEVHTRFSMLPETLFLAVNIIDRFLSVKVVRLDKFQLVGVTALLIASKYEEAVTLHVQHYARLADNGFTEDEILRAERFILSSLDYNLSYPNPMNFLRHISKADQYEIATRTIAKYLTEISILDNRFMEFLPSHTAAAAMYLSRMIFDRGEWDDHLVYYSDYTEEEVLPVVRLMIDYLASPVRHRAFHKKYANKRFMKASLVARSWAKKYVATNPDLFEQQEETESS